MEEWLLSIQDQECEYGFCQWVLFFFPLLNCVIIYGRMAP